MSPPLLVKSFGIGSTFLWFLICWRSAIPPWLSVFTSLDGFGSTDRSAPIADKTRCPLADRAARLAAAAPARSCAQTTPSAHGRSGVADAGHQLRYARSRRAQCQQTPVAVGHRVEQRTVRRTRRSATGGGALAGVQQACGACGSLSSRAGKCASGTWASGLGSGHCRRWPRRPISAGRPSCAGLGRARRVADAGADNGVPQPGVSGLAPVAQRHAYKHRRPNQAMNMNAAAEGFALAACRSCDRPGRRQEQPSASMPGPVTRGHAGPDPGGQPKPTRRPSGAGSLDLAQRGALRLNRSPYLRPISTRRFSSAVGLAGFLRSLEPTPSMTSSAGSVPLLTR